MDIMSAIFVLVFTQTGCLLAIITAFNRLRKGEENVLLYQVLIFLSGAASIMLLTWILLYAVNK